MIDNDKRGIKYEGKDIQRETSQIVKDVLEKTNLKQGSIFVLGLSSSEVIGGQIGKESSQEIGEIIVKTILDILEEKRNSSSCFKAVNMSIGLSLLNVRLQNSLVWKWSVSFLLFMQEVRVNWQPSSLCRIQLRLNLSRLMLDWISETLQLACMLSMFRFRFALF